MSKIAILDTGIDEKQLQCGKFQSYDICKQDCKSQSGFSHGTICARILEQFTSDYELISIQILAAMEEGEKKPFGHIEHLREGLQLCIQLNVDIVCLSAVSSVLSDSRDIFRIAEKLAQTSIIVAALDNRDYMTIPTGYPFVTGVQADRAGVLAPGEIACAEQDPFYAEIYANCNIEFLKQSGIVPSNSFAVPIVAAQIHNWLKEKKDWKAELKRLKPYPCDGRWRQQWKKEERKLQPDIPIVIVYGKNDEKVFSACRSFADVMYKKYKVQASMLHDMDGEYDIRFRRVKSDQVLEWELLFMEYHYKTELIFLAVHEEGAGKICQRVCADVRIELRSQEFYVQYENQFEKCTWEAVPDMLWKILEGG